MLVGLVKKDSGAISQRRDIGDDYATVNAVCGYMPEKFSLYTDLTVEENMNFFADIQQVPPRRRDELKQRLLEKTGMARFSRRRAGALSGGMKQKLALSAILLSSPELIILDEPTTGVDPLSRIEFFAIIEDLKREGRTIVLSTPYLDEAEKGDFVVLIKNGQGAAPGRHRPPEARLPRPPVPHPAARQRLRGHAGDRRRPAAGRPRPRARQVHPLPAGRPRGHRRPHPAPGDPRGAADFGRHLYLLRGGGHDPGGGHRRPEACARTSAALRPSMDVSFAVQRGEIMGFLGPNGAGKTTTIKMITGLLKITSGTVTVAGLDNRRHLALIKRKLGYMSQKFSLYPLLTSLENIEFFGGISGLAPAGVGAQVERLRQQVPATSLQQKIHDVPPGIRQKVALFVCLLPDPEIILLDEPTSGVDPEARPPVWQEIYLLKKAGKTILIHHPPPG